MREKYLNKLVAILKKEKIDAILIAPSEEMEFIMGHNTHLCERFQALIIRNDGSYFYICNLLRRMKFKVSLGQDIKALRLVGRRCFTDYVLKRLSKSRDLTGKTRCCKLYGKSIYNSSDNGSNDVNL